MQHPLKVMLVDDEVMALNNLKNLIDWDREGYNIVAKETNPQKALDSFSKLRPHIVFIDIMMPVMNGLELSEKILSLDIPVKVIILTSYKDFQYAKRAIRIGVSNYLVKHEMNKDNLISELKKLREDLNKEKLNDRIVRHRLIRALIDGKNPYDITDRIKNRYLKFDIVGMIFLFCKVDRSYPFIKEHNSIQGFQTDLRWSEIDTGSNSEGVDIIGLNREEVVYVIYLDSIPSLDISWKIINSMYQKIQSQFLNMHGRTISGFPVIVKNKIETIGNIYSKVQRVFNDSIFFGKSALIDPAEIIENDDKKVCNLTDYFNEITNCLNVLDGESLKIPLDKIFKLQETPPFNFHWLRETCTKLVTILDDFLKKHLQPSLFSVNSKIGNRIDLDNIYNISDIALWFEKEFSLSINEAKAINAGRYSRKVHQTMDLIHQQYNKDWSIEEIAETLSISAVYLRKIFKNETGSTIVHYLTELRMNKSIDLLETGNYKVFEVSEMVGYNTSQYFSKVFRKHTGKSPMDYVSGV